jgi:hypothetical protein
MERFFINTCVGSVYVGRESTSDWGVRHSGETVEMWVGKTYICADYSRRRIMATASYLVYATFIFTIGLYLDPPAFADNALHAVHDVLASWMLPDSPL